MRAGKKRELSQRRHWRVRQKVTGTLERPRMSVKFTGENIYVQFIDDQAGQTLAAGSTLNKSGPDRERLAGNPAEGKRIGQNGAEAAEGKGNPQVGVERGGA